MANTKKEILYWTSLVFYGAILTGVLLYVRFPAEKFPASTWIGVTALAMPDFLVEIEAMAVI